MPRVNVEDIPWAEFVSPKGAYRGRYLEISLALGAKKHAGPAGGGHPFDVTLEVLAPGETCCPYHAHTAQWEFFYILNSGTEDLSYLIIAHNPPVDPCVYPDSGKAYISVPGGEKLIRYGDAADLDYFDGQE